MFMSQYNHTIDAKGRVFIPAKYRDALGERFVVTKGLDGCLFLYPNEQWEQFAEKLKALPGTKEARQLQRFFLAGAAEMEIDGQGRILIPAKLREHAALGKQAVFVGMIGRVELWSEERWENNTLEDMDEAAEKMAEQGLVI